MAEWLIPINHLLEFAGEEERQYYLSPDRTEAERNEIRSELEEVYQSIPVSEAELKQYMGENAWRDTQHNPSARDLAKARWKGFRKAKARAELEKYKREQREDPDKALGVRKTYTKEIPWMPKTEIGGRASPDSITSQKHIAEDLQLRPEDSMREPHELKVEVSDSLRMDDGDREPLPVEERVADGHWFDHGLLANPLLLAVLTMIAFAITFSPKASGLATWICLLFAWGLFTRMVFVLSHKRKHKWLITGLLSLVALLAFSLFGWWLERG